MKYILSIIFSAAFLIACGSHKERSAPKDTIVTPSASLTECYQYANAKDTITLKLGHTDTSVTGTLTYKLYQKDINQGLIHGSMQGNLLVADYIFISEGRSSLREVVFKKDNDSYIEGYGDVVTNEDMVGFRNRDSLQFDTSRRLLPFKCMDRLQ
jgi:hypothetical protein